MSGTGYAWDPLYLGHKTSTIHPERPERVAELSFKEVQAEVSGLTRVVVESKLGMPWARRVHDADYMTKVRTAFAKGKSSLDPGRETLVREDTHDVALQSLSGALTVVRDVLSGSLRNGFAAVRPPGHHAGVGNARGFCIFNNAAVCATFARLHFGLERVLIVDWDIHPGDGTMAIFYRDPNVHVLSIHQTGILGGAGKDDHVGRDEGEGATWNRNLPKGTTGPEFHAAFRPILETAAAACQPDLIIVSSGFDGHAADPVGGWRLGDEDYFDMTSAVAEVADKYCDGRMVSILEGGYNPRALKRSVLAHVSALVVA